ncbi:hypothetical protein [Hoeflea ulvae]|uniref:Uncharacterized protein n=1 Tax=Hoeflea ulvae TaxID=2983764 RepID=A0ABT3YDW1_9HYPH|nr:hypothetical protein [Hoeflea ulvae]MCY0093930.1 hypothetical protein [Hoeflea ulvae]
MESKMKKEYQVVIEGELPKGMEEELNGAIKEVVMNKLAKIDLRSANMKERIASLRPIGGGHTDGLWVEIR